MPLYLTRVLKKAWEQTMSDFGVTNWRSSLVKALWVGIAVFIMHSFNWTGLVIDTQAYSVPPSGT